MNKAMENRDCTGEAHVSEGVMKDESGWSMRRMGSRSKSELVHNVGTAKMVAAHKVLFSTLSIGFQ